MEKVKFYTHQNNELKKEAIQLLQTLGYVWKGESHHLEQRLPDAIYGNEGGLILLDQNLSLIAFKELSRDYRHVTIEDLQSMIVLKRNDLNDATHETLEGNLEYLELNEKFYYFGADGWLESPETDVWHANNLRPIPSPSTLSVSNVAPVLIKEFLDPENSYQYFKTTDVGINPSWISIPEGAHLYFMEWFYKRENEIWYAWMGNSVWTETEYQFNTTYANVHWVRDGIELPKPENKHPVESSLSLNPNINADYILLDGEAAKQAWVNGSKIQISPIKSIPEWEDLNVKVATLDCFEKKFLFRCKPHTIMLNGVELKPWNSVQVNYEKFQIRIDCADVESASHTYEEIRKVFSNRSVDWSNKS